MLDKNKEYGYEFEDEFSRYQVRFWFDSSYGNNVWVREERHRGYGEGDVWTEWSGFELPEDEIVEELATCT